MERTEGIVEGTIVGAVEGSRDGREVSVGETDRVKMDGIVVGTSPRTILGLKVVRLTVGL